MKNNNKKISNIAAFTLVVMVLFISIISIELITIIYSDKYNKNYIDILKTTVTTTTNKTYDVESLNYSDVSLTSKASYISNLCTTECNLKINMYGEDYYYIIRTGKDNNYILTITKETTVILENENIGTNLSDSYFINYNNFILFYTQLENSDYTYDYAIVVDNRGKVDKFSSVSLNEFEFTDNGIIYYYDECISDDSSSFNAKRIQAIRTPFGEAEVLTIKETNYSWCNNN